MNLTSFLANKCLEYLLKFESNQGDADQRLFSLQNPPKDPSHSLFPPPWSVARRLFKERCDGCGVCVSHCENNIIRLGKYGHPGVDFSRGSCSFCGACAQNCPQGALRYDPDTVPWHVRAFIAGSCLMQNRVVCSTCTERCEKEAIILSKTKDKKQVPEIIAEKCDGCGACSAACPVGAITFADNKPKSKS